MVLSAHATAQVFDTVNLFQGSETNFGRVSEKQKFSKCGELFREDGSLSDNFLMGEGLKIIIPKKKIW